MYASTASNSSTCPPNRKLLAECHEVNACVPISSTEFFSPQTIKLWFSGISNFEAGADLVGLGGPVTKDGVSGVSKNVLAFRNAINEASKVGYRHEVSQ